MKKYIILLFFITFSLFGSQEAHYKNLEEVVAKIVAINTQFLTIQKQDGNTTKTSQEFASIDDEKEKLIAMVPAIITNSSYKAPLSAKEYKKTIQQLQKKIKNTKNALQNALNNVQLTKIEVTNTFYEAVKNLHDDQKSISRKKLSSNLEKSLLAIKSIQLPKQELFTSKEGHEAFLETKSTILAYDQILSYIKENLKFFQSNYLFETLDINTVIKYINELIPINNAYFNLGKIIICLLIFSFFWFLRFLLRKRTFTIFVLPVKRQHYPPQTKASIVKSTNKPMLFFLWLIAADICVSILYQPSIPPENLNIAISILYIITFAWLIMSIINGYSIAFLSYLASKKSAENFRKEAINFIIKILFSIVTIIALLASLHKMGFDISAILASLGIGGLAVAFAAKDILANFFSSIMLLFDNSFSQGDWIKCGEAEGTVIEIGMRRTTIRTFDNAMLFVPNAKLASEVVLNWNRRRVGRRIKMHIGITYDSPKEKIEQCVDDIREMLLAHPLIAKPTDTTIDPQDRGQSFKEHIVSVNDLKGYKRTLLVYLDQFSGSSIDILVYCFSQSAVWQDWLIAKQDILLKIMDIVYGHGLSFAFPSQSLYVEHFKGEFSKEAFLEHHLSQKEDS